MVNNPAGKFSEMRGKSPEEAKFFWNGGPIALGERTWFASLLSGVTAFETDEGLVLVDSGTVAFAPHLAQEIRSETSSPVHTAIFTHGHVDHAFGLSAFLLPDQTAPRVIGHRAMLERFDRYQRTASANQVLNARQFGGSAHTPAMGVAWEAPTIGPDTLYDDTLEITVGGIEFQLFHARGETDDHTWVYCPERGVLCPGDLIIWGVPNAGNPQKVQRYPWDWANALRDMAAKKPKTLAPGHGGPIVDDPKLVARVLIETADFLEAIVERTIKVMEDGSPPHVDIVHSVELPVSDSPWLQPIYDEAEFIVRNVVRYFGGWFSGRPSELKPAARDQVAQAIASLAGGAAGLVVEAQRFVALGDLVMASHFADYALEAAPSDPAVGQAVAEIYDARAAKETSLMAINLHTSTESRSKLMRMKT
jgi:glyoxylase-like metal-dependent hydrolase (beta-lactamase superfamily II)